MWGSKVVGISASVAIGSLIMSRSGFHTAALLFSVLIGGIMLFPVLLRERTGERLLPWTRGVASAEALATQLHDWRTIFGSLIRVLFLPVSLMMGMAAFSASVGRGLIDTLLPVMTVQELGWLDSEYSNVFATGSLIAGLGGMFIVAFYTLTCFFTISVFATAMQMCWKRVSASQFTLYMAVSNLGLSAGAWLFGMLASSYDYQIVMSAYVVFALFSLAMTRLVKLEVHGHRLAQLESEH